MTRDQHFMRYAIEEAKKSLVTGDVPIGAIVVSGDDIIARAHNEREARNDPTAHAEILALQKAGIALGNWHMEHCDMFVTHEPCPMCAGALIMARIHRVIYGCNEPKSGVCGTLMNLVQFPGFAHNVRISGPIAQDECAGLTKAFFKEKR